MEFDLILERVLNEETEPNFKSAVAIVQQHDKWLLGLSRAKDDRGHKWCHPGGGIKYRETPEKAAERECFEETGIKCKAIGDPFRDARHKGVAFVHCKTTTSDQKIDINHEFSAAGWFTLIELRTLQPLYKNVLKLIKRAKKQ